MCLSFYNLVWNLVVTTLDFIYYERKINGLNHKYLNIFIRLTDLCALCILQMYILKDKPNSQAV